MNTATWLALLSRSPARLWGPRRLPPKPPTSRSSTLSTLTDDVAAHIVLLLKECRVFRTLQLWATGRHHTMTNAAAALSATLPRCASPTSLWRRLVASELLAAEAALLTFVVFHMPPCPMWALTHSITTCHGHVHSKDGLSHSASSWT